MRVDINPATGRLDLLGPRQSSLDARYLKLDASNDPITGPLSILTTNQTEGPLTIVVDQTNGGTSSQFNMTVYTTAQAPAFNFSRALNTLASPQTMTGAQRILTMRQDGYNGTGAFQGVTQILFETDGTSGNTLGGRIRMYTATVGGALTEALRIDDDQRVTLNASTATLTIGSSTPSSTEVVSTAITFDNTSGTRKVFDAAGTTFAPSNNTSGQLQAVNAEAVIDTTASGFNFTNSIGAAGFQGKVTINGTGGTVTGVRGGNFIVTNAGTATITTAVTAAFLATQNTGGGSVGSAIGVMIADQTVGGTNNTNLLVGGTSTPSGSYNIYAPSTKDNYFGGNVGIGLTPAVRFHVYESTNGDMTSRFQNPSTGTSARVFLQFTNNTPASGYLMVTGSNYTGVAGWGDRYIFNSDTTLTGGMLMRPGAGGFQVSANGTNNANFYVSPSTGFVGVGTTSPGSTFTVDGTTATVLVTTNTTNGITLESKTTAATNNIFRFRALGTIGGGSANQRVRFTENDGTNELVVGELLTSLNNAAGARYVGFLANHDRDGEQYPIRFFTETLAGTATTSFLIGAGADQGKVIVGNSTTALGVLTVYGQSSVDTAVFQGVASGFPIVTLKRNDGTVTAGESLGQLQWVTNDATVTTEASQVGAYIAATANTAFTTDAAPTDLTFYTSGTTVAGSPIERLRITPTETVHNGTGIDHDFRVEGNTNTSLFQLDAGNDRAGVNVAAPLGKLDVVQNSTTAAIPTLKLTQSDLSEEFVRFSTTIAAGNPLNTTALGAYYGRARVYVEGVGAKWLALYD